MRFSDIEVRVSEVLSDIGTITYTLDQLRQWIIESELALIGLVNSSNIVTESHYCEPGTMQNLSSGGVRLHSVIRNMGSGAVPGPAIRLVDRSTKDEFEPDWHMAEQEAVIQEYIYDERNPTKFMVSPPALPNTFVELELTKEGGPYNIATDELMAVSDVYMAGLVEWVLYRCFSRSDEDTPEYARSHSHYSKFLQLIGIKSQVDKSTSPKTREHLN